MTMQLTLPRAAIRAALCFAATRDSQRYLNGVLFEVHHDAVHLVATNGRMLGAIRIDAAGTVEGIAPSGAFEMIIPREALEGIGPDKRGDPAHVTLTPTENGQKYEIRDGASRVDNEPRRITWLACEATGTTYNRKHEGMRMDGCGMNMCFAAVYNLGSALWPEGTPEPHGRRNGQPDSAGGYALNQRDL